MRSILTIKTPACSAARNLISELATVVAEGHGEAALAPLRECGAPIHDRSKWRANRPELSRSRS